MHLFLKSRWILVRQGDIVLNSYSLVFIVLIFFSTAISAQNSSTNYPIDEQINNQEIANHKLWSSYQQPKNSLEAYWNEWSEAEIQEAENWFYNSEYNPQKLRREIQWFEAEYEEDKQNWENIKENYGLLEDQKERYLKFLKDENKLFIYYNIYYGNKLQAIRMYDGNWVEEFTKECIEDYLIVAKETLFNVDDEVRNCVVSVLTSAMRAGLMQSVTVDFESPSENLKAIVDDAKSCVWDIPFQSLIFALESALRRQFIKDMQERNIYEEVARYWWDDIIMDRKKMLIYEESINNLASLEDWIKYFSAEEIKKYSAKEAIPKIMVEVKKWYKEEYTQQILEKGLEGTEASKQFRQKALKKIKKKAIDQTVDHINNQLFSSFSFLYDYLKRVYVISEGRYKFYQIAEKEIAKYKHISKCLKKNNIPGSSKKMIEIISKNEEEFLVWYKANCKDPDCNPKQLTEETIDKLKTFETNIDKTIDEVSKNCLSVKESIDAAQNQLKNEAKSKENQQSIVPIETLKSELNQRIVALQKLKSKGDECSVAAGIYHKYSTGKAGGICEETSFILELPDENLQMKGSITAVGSLSEAVEYFQQISDNLNQLNSLFGLAEQLKNDIITKISGFETSFTQYLKPEVLAGSAANPLINNAIDKYTSVDEELKRLEIDYKQLKKDYEKALAIESDYEKRDLLVALKQRIDDKMRDSKICYSETGVLISSIEKSLDETNVNIKHQERLQKPNLSDYNTAAEAIVNEMKSDRSEVVEYQNNAQNAISDAGNCLDELTDYMRQLEGEKPGDESEEIEDDEQLSSTDKISLMSNQVSDATAEKIYKALDQDEKKDDNVNQNQIEPDNSNETAELLYYILSQDGANQEDIAESPAETNNVFSEVESGVTVTQSGKSSASDYMKNEETTKALQDHYQAQSMSGYGSKGLSTSNMNNLFNDFNDYQSEERQQIQDDMRNDLLNSISQTVHQFTNMVSKNRVSSTAEREQKLDYMSSDPYQAYRNAFDATETKSPITNETYDVPETGETTGDDTKNEGSYDFYLDDGDAVNLLEIQAEGDD